MGETWWTERPTSGPPCQPALNRHAGGASLTSRQAPKVTASLSPAYCVPPHMNPKPRATWPFVALGVSVATMLFVAAVLVVPLRWAPVPVLGCVAFWFVMFRNPERRFFRLAQYVFGVWAAVIVRSAVGMGAELDTDRVDAWWHIGRIPGYIHLLLFGLLCLLLLLDWRQQSHTHHSEVAPRPSTIDGRAAPALVLDVVNCLVALSVVVGLGVSLPALWSGSHATFWIATLLVLMGMVLLVWTIAGRTKRNAREKQLERWGSIDLLESAPSKFQLGSLRASDEFPPRPDRAEHEVLERLKAPNASVLLLEGYSGTGKTSLLEAWVIPRLLDERPRPVVIEAPPFNCCLRLREELLREGIVWKRPPARLSKLATAELLKAAGKKAKADGRHVFLILDHFEVALLKHAESPNPATEELAAILRGLAEQGNDGLSTTAVLSYRAEYYSRFENMGLRELPSNRVESFSRNDAAAFLIERVALSEDQLRAVLDECETVTDTRGLIRPVVLQMLGRALSRNTHREITETPRGAFISTELASSINRSEVRDYSRPVLRHLLTNGARILDGPRVGEIADALKLDPAQIDGCLRALRSDADIVRLVEDSGRPRERRWEVSHDFVARLLEPLLDTGHGLPILVRRGAGLLLLLATSVFASVYFSSQKIGAVRDLAEAGLWWDGEQAGVFDSFASRRSVTRIPVAPLRTLGVRGLDLEGCFRLTSLEGLSELSALQTLNLESCQDLTNLEGLSELPALQTLNLESCQDLTSLEGFSELPALQTLNLRNCIDLPSLQGFPELPVLKALDLSSSNGLTCLEGFPELPALQTLNLTRSLELASLEGLPELPVLQALYLSDCYDLVNLEGLPELPALQALYLSSCYGLVNLEGFTILPALLSLHLDGCIHLTSLEGFSELPALQTLNLETCFNLASLEWLPDELPALQSLNLSGCDSLTSLEGLPDKLPALHTLTLWGCEGLTSLKGLPELPALRTLDLRGCERITSLEGLPESLQKSVELIGSSSLLGE